MLQLLDRSDTTVATSYTTDPIDVIDVDSHYSPPPGFWEAHAPARFKARVPRIGEDEHGMPQWLVDGMPFDSIGFNMVRPDGTKAPGNMRALPHFEQMHAGSYDVAARVAWLDEHGIANQIMYPNTGGFSSQMFFTKIADEELRNVCLRTYNDAASALQEESGGRLVPLSQIPWWDIDEAETELGTADLVLGPSRDGGYYLIAMSSPHDVFTGVAMSTPEVLLATQARAEAARLRVHLLPASFDIDDVTDLHRFREELSDPQLAAHLPATAAWFDRRLPAGGRE